MRYSHLNFEPFEYESDGRDDYYDQTMGSITTNDHIMRGSLLSGLWARRRFWVGDGRKSPQQVAQDMIRIRNAVQSFLKIHGLPPMTSIRLAVLGQETMGTCKREGRGYVITLDKAIYNNCEPDEMLDLYCGIGLHEASHANHTRLMFQLLEDKVYKPGFESILAGLFEDERIEELARQESPGFAPYLSATKRILFEKQEFGAAVKKWSDDTPDTDTIRMMIFGFIRCPYLLTEEMKAFNLIDGSNPWKDLRKMLKCMPVTEEDVRLMTKKVMRWYRRKCKLYSQGMEDLKNNMADATGDETWMQWKPETGDDFSTFNETEQKILNDAANNQEDKDTEYWDDKNKEQIQDKGTSSSGIRPDTQSDAIDEKVSTVIENGQANSELTNRDEDEESIIDSWRIKDQKQDRDDLEENKEELADREKKRKEKGSFGESDIKRMMERANTVTDPMTAQELREYMQADAQRMEFLDKWGGEVDFDGEHQESNRRNILVHPQPEGKETDRGPRLTNDAIYEVWKEDIKQHINRMRSVFRFRLGHRNYRETEKKRGRLHRRRLARSQSTDRIFYRKHTKSDNGIAICLLLDESGSMGYVDTSSRPHLNGKSDAVARLAVLMAEVLKDVPGVELEVYSYTSCGSNGEDNHMKYLYGKNNPDVRSIGAYNPGQMNYDHQAIKTAANLFKKNTENDNRLMIVMSDGQPHGSNYGGPEAEELTKRTALEVEKRGVEILHIAIEDFDNRCMFKNSLQFTDIPELINNMRRLMTKIIKRATEE
tara:strand:+ start:2106 stop:4409 length:2304 start_codon:yes stop_codon:yes gene_type:complete